MANETHQSIRGNLTDAPKIFWTKDGKAMARFTVASTPTYFDPATRTWQDKETTFMPCFIKARGGEKTNSHIEHLAHTFAKGDPVIVLGDLETRVGERDGEPTRILELRVTDMGPSWRLGNFTIDRDKRHTS